MIDSRTFYNFAEVPLYIGYHGENLVTGVDIDLANVLPDGWGAGLLLRRAGESSGYEATSTLEGSVLRVTFETFDCLKEGRGEATVELRGPNGEKRKSSTAQTIVEHALDLSGVPPERPELYRTAAQQDVIDAGKISKAAQAEKTADMTQPVGVDADGKLWVPPGGGGGSSDELWRPAVDSAGNISWEKSASSTPPTTQNIKGQPGAAGRDGTDGQDGRDGTDGEDGFSPAVTVAQITGGHRVNITDKTHPSGQSFDVLDGEDGAQGAPGTPGAAAGFGTPTATVDANVGTPSVTVTASGADTSKIFSFAFRNLKGQQGQQGIQGLPGENGRDGADGKSAYASAQDGGYTGTEQQFNSDLADVGEKIGEAPNDGQQYARKNKAWAVVQGGGGGAVIDDTAGAGDTDKAWSADKLTTELGGKADADAVLPKPASGLAVGKYFRVATYNSTTGAVTLEAVNDPAAVKGVRAYTTDLVPDENGIVTIPIAGSAVPGVFKLSGTYGLSTVSGALRGRVETYQNYPDINQYAFISKGTLENVLTAYGAKPNIKTAMDSVAVAGAKYYLGEQTAVSIVLPSNATVGQQITVVWYNGATAATLSITGAPIGESFTPTANSRSKAVFEWDGTNWAISHEEISLN